MVPLNIIFVFYPVFGSDCNQSKFCNKNFAKIKGISYHKVISVKSAIHLNLSKNREYDHLKKVYWQPFLVFFSCGRLC